MSDSEDIVFEAESPADDFEVAVLKAGEDVPVQESPDPNAGKVVMTAEEFAQLQKSGDSTATLSQGLNALAEKLGMPQAPANVPTPQDEYDPAKLEASLFEAGKSVGTIEQIVEKKLGGVQAQLAQALVNQNKQLLKLDPGSGALFKRFEGEIEKRIAGIPMQYRLQPTIYQQVYQQVLLEHQDEIVAARVEEEVKKRLAEKAPEVGRKPAMFNEQGGAVPGKPVQKVYLTQADVQRMSDSMLDPKNKDHVRTYLELKKERGWK